MTVRILNTKIRIIRSQCEDALKHLGVTSDQEGTDGQFSVTFSGSLSLIKQLYFDFVLVFYIFLVTVSLWPSSRSTSLLIPRQLQIRARHLHSVASSQATFSCS